jgi:hypothetical protein
MKPTVFCRHVSDIRKVIKAATQLCRRPKGGQYMMITQGGLQPTKDRPNANGKMKMLPV